MSTTFDYRARDTAGAERKGQLGGSSAMAVARELATMGLVPVEIRARAQARPRPWPRRPPRRSARPAAARWRRPERKAPAGRP
jgi:type II secretory pathway component PulF